MSANAKRSVGATLALILLGMLVLMTGEKLLVVMIPVAILIWYAASPTLRSGRN
jgi:hypothetical protein